MRFNQGSKQRNSAIIGGIPRKSDLVGHQRYPNVDDGKCDHPQHCITDSKANNGKGDKSGLL
jgi:hypothetical protein